MERELREGLFPLYKGVFPSREAYFLRAKVHFLRAKVFPDVCVRRALALRHERALGLEREERRLHPRASLVEHLAHPVPMGPNGKVVVLTAEGVEEDETQGYGNQVKLSSRLI